MTTAISQAEPPHGSGVGAPQNALPCVAPSFQGSRLSLKHQRLTAALILKQFHQ